MERLNDALSQESITLIILITTLIVIFSLVAKKSYSNHLSKMKKNSDAICS
jgi:Tfp pilus assembly protein PilE